MTWTQLPQQISSISPADRGAMEAARRRWDAIAKPLRGLGRLEDLLVRMAGVTGSPDLDLGRKAVAVFCADNGVVAEGVTQTGQEVTWTVAQTMGERRSSVCHMARTAGAQVFPVDLGMARRDTPPGVRPCVVLEGGTRNMTKGPAMPREAAERALEVNRPDPGDPVDILCKVGGLDIAAMTGFYLGCAAAQVPVILDGAISAAAALLAVRLCPNAEKALLPSHWPSEPCGQALLAALGLEPVLHGNFHLGEGTGAVALMPLLDMAQSVYRDMSTFGGMGIGAYRPDGERVPAKVGPEDTP